MPEYGTMGVSEGGRTGGVSKKKMMLPITKSKSLQAASPGACWRIGSVLALRHSERE